MQKSTEKKVIELLRKGVSLTCIKRTQGVSIPEIMSINQNQREPNKGAIKKTNQTRNRPSRVANVSKQQPRKTRKLLEASKSGSSSPEINHKNKT